MAKKKSGLPAKTTKPGPLSKEERGTIKRLIGKQSPEQMAKMLNRPISVIQKFLLSLEEEPEDVALSLTSELHRRPEWRKFQTQFTEDELSFFTYRYVQLMDQFGRENTTTTEEMQMFSLIQVEILIDRNLREQKVNDRVMLDLQQQIEEMSNIHNMEEEDINLLLELNTQYDTARAGAKSAADRFKQLSGQQSSTFKELKATRDQRVKVNDNPANSFLGLMKQLNDADFARQAGREAEMMRLAAETERTRLSQPHRYEDKVVDQPILTSETLIDDYEQYALPAPESGEDQTEES